MQMQSSQNFKVPALLGNGNAATTLVHYPKEQVYLLRDEKGVDALNEKFEYVNI